MTSKSGVSIFDAARVYNCTQDMSWQENVTGHLLRPDETVGQTSSPADSSYLRVTFTNEGASSSTIRTDEINNRLITGMDFGIHLTRTHILDNAFTQFVLAGFFLCIEQEPRGLSHGLEDHFNHIWRYLEPFRAIYSHLVHFEAIWCHLETFGAIWSILSHLETVGAILSHLEPFEAIFSYLDPC